jgi:hypothetical protein
VGYLPFGGAEAGPAGAGRHRGSAPGRCAKSFWLVIRCFEGWGAAGFLAVSSGLADQVSVVPAWRADEGVMVSLAA